jgi:uncharacterized protein YbjT (DUF2867 family)
MNKDYKTATVFGGTGFVGRQIVRELARRGVVVKVASRAPERAYFLRTTGVVGQIVPFACNYNDPKSIAAAVKGSDYVVNCVGMLYERRRGDFKKSHAEIPAKIAEACKAAGVKRFVHISIPNIEADQSRYAQTKLEGEKAVRQNFPKTIILRPSVIFGPDDDFFNKFAGLARIMPVLPLIGGGNTRFQPVYVGDVADAAIICLTGDAELCGRVFELAGPETLTFRQIYERLFKYTKRRRPFITLPWKIASVQACFMGLMPKPLLTKDQVTSLKTDYTIAENALNLHDLGITPTPMDLILPTYLSAYQPGGKFADKKAA